MQVEMYTLWMVQINNYMLHLQNICIAKLIIFIDEWKKNEKKIEKSSREWKILKKFRI